MLLECVCLLACALTVAYLYLRRNFDFWKRQNVPYDKPLPFVGSRVRQFLLQCHEGVDTDRVYQQFYHSPYAGLFEGDEPVLLLKEPRLIKEFFVNETALPLTRRIHEDETNPFTQSLPFTTGPRGNFIRAKMTRDFTTARMKAAFLLFLSNADALRDALLRSDGRAVNTGDLINCFTMDNLASWTFGIDVDSTQRPDNEFRRQMNLILGTDKLSYFGRLMSWFLQPLFKPLNLTFPTRDSLRYMDKVVGEVTASRQESSDCVFLRLLDAVDHEQQGSFRWTADMATANSFALVVAGSETSAATMAWCLLELALNSDLQDKLHSEIRSVSEREGGTFTYESFKDLKYLDMVIQETLRKWPAAVSVGRIASASFVLPGTKVVLKPGAGVLFPIYSIHRDPKYYPDPERFDPERFNEKAKAEREPYTYLPFSVGSHICIGLRLALLQLKIGVAAIVNNFQIQTCEKTILPVQISPTGFSTVQTGGTWLRFVKREV